MTPNHQIIKIQIAKKQLGIDDDTYRALLKRFGNKNTTSSKQLSPLARAKLIKHFEDCGFNSHA